MRNEAKMYLNTQVVDIKIENNKVKSVITNRGEIQTELVINATGAYAPMIVNGRFIHTDKAPSWSNNRYRAGTKLINADILCAKIHCSKYNPEILEDSESHETRLGVGLSLSQTLDGQILIGATREFVGYNKSTTRSS